MGLPEKCLPVGRTLSRRDDRVALEDWSWDGVLQKD